ncbi:MULTISPECIES: hypothetical protein [Cyanophyceae]|nr:hypothetical protein [Trichocoleus sp. FACHB-40]
MTSLNLSPIPLKFWLNLSYTDTEKEDFYGMAFNFPLPGVRLRG